MQYCRSCHRQRPPAHFQDYPDHAANNAPAIWERSSPTSSASAPRPRPTRPAPSGEYLTAAQPGAPRRSQSTPAAEKGLLESLRSLPLGQKIGIGATILASGVALVVMARGTPFAPDGAGGAQPDQQPPSWPAY